ncbi:MAG: ATP-binding protein [Patescibacteria group bacterium]|nr:ATP-binding protein [Patescibacteria group bacterium]MDE2438509.1 ATP-binding protein [Patescibacteria group bacterium]
MAFNFPFFSKKKTEDQDTFGPLPSQYKFATDTLQDLLAPPGIEATNDYLKIGSLYTKTLFLFSYPNVLSSGWFSSVINIEKSFDIAIYLDPMDTATALKNLRKKVAQIESQLMEQQEKGLVRDPLLEASYKNIEGLRDSLQQAEEKLFNLGIYITIYATDTSELQKYESEVAGLLEGRMIYIKPTLFEHLEGFQTTLPLVSDKVQVYTPFDTVPISTLFPFDSAELTSDDGILYGVNMHNNSLIIFDRFSLENANMVIFAKSGSGKSFFTKLEILRSLMMGTDILIIDPENEYQALSEAIGGGYFRISLSSEHRINPFDLPPIPPDESPSDVLRSHILMLTGLIKIMVGEITPTEEALIDQALLETYASREIVPDSNFTGKTPPLLSDLQTVLESIEGGADLAKRLEKYTKGTYAGFLNSPSNVQIRNRLTVFNIRDLEEELRPIAMYMILNFMWSLIRAEFRKRLLIVDEAWVLMKYEDGANFLFGMAKRGRKYFLGITTITQDIDDFLRSPYGRPIVTNSSLQLLLKQSPATIDIIGTTFNLTEAEKMILLEANVGEGIFFAGLRHAAIHVIASYTEGKLASTKPQELLARMEGKTETQ